MNTRPPSAFDDFREVQSQYRGPGIAGWWNDLIPLLTDDQAEALKQAATDRTISHRTISIVLRRWGHEITVAQVGHWRRNHVR